MATITTPHWKDTAIERAAIITDAWEVVKAWTGRAAEWILFLCMIANIIEILVHVSLLFSDIVLGIQVVTLDIAGFGLMSIAQNARANGDEQGAKRATHTAYLLITIMLLTVLLFTLGLLVPSVRSYMDIAEKGLILVRVGMTVLYGHILHSLNRVSTVAPRKVIETLQDELNVHRQQMRQEITALHTHYQQEIAHLTEQHQQSMDRQKNELHTIQNMLMEMQKTNPCTEQQKADSQSCEIVHFDAQANSTFSVTEVFGWSDEHVYQEWSNTPVQVVAQTPEIACVEAPVEHVQNTDELPVVSQPNTPRMAQKTNSVKRAGKPLQRRSTRKAKRTRGDATEQVREVLEANSKASLTDIVNETGLSRSRVSEIRTAILREWEEKTNSLSQSAP